ncbi:ribosome maturation factor RimM, putative (RimM) [Plasmodium malariae]|uniref:Ribosome maturation factor RimM, putative (RimM) n=1 Tax=Plasmodium malariae TaxID=5858 RepID=A0A1A8WS60_PLAMA|nr:ribosome maturation factor RimM, putative (RimM) [Plasmodium malariae]
MHLENLFKTHFLLGLTWTTSIQRSASSSNKYVPLLNICYRKRRKAFPHISHVGVVFFKKILPRQKNYFCLNNYNECNNCNECNKRSGRRRKNILHFISLKNVVKEKKRQTKNAFYNIRKNIKKYEAFPLYSQEKEGSQNNINIKPLNRFSDEKERTDVSKRNETGEKSETGRIESNDDDDDGSNADNENGDNNENDHHNDNDNENGDNNENYYDDSEGTSTRHFLTETKYYKRSKYSKAGYMKEKKSYNYTPGKEENHSFDDFINSETRKSYTESKEELIRYDIKKSLDEATVSLPDLLYRNYYSDRNRSNDLDLLHEKDKKGIQIKGNIVEPNTTCQIKQQGKDKRSEGNSKISIMSEYTVIGEIVGVHGLLGWLKVVSFTTFNDIRFKKNCYRYLIINNNPNPLPIKIVDIKESLKVGFLYIKLEDINSRTDGLKLKNCLICDDKRNFPDIEENQYISTDLLNFDIYIFNDFTNTCIGKVFTFLSKYDYICRKSMQEISDDLIKIQLNKNIPLQRVFHIINASKVNVAPVSVSSMASNTSNSMSSTMSSSMTNNSTDIHPTKNLNPIRVLINRKNFDLYQHEDRSCDTESNDPSERIKDDKNYYDSLDNFDGCSYKKIYKCEFCDDIYDNVSDASKHESTHFQTDEEMLYNASQLGNDKEKIYEVTQKDAKRVKNVDYFFVPIVKERTIRSVNYEMKKIYLNISTVFLLDKQK